MRKVYQISRRAGGFQCRVIAPGKAYDLLDPIGGDEMWADDAGGREDLAFSILADHYGELPAHVASGERWLCCRGCYGVQIEKWWAIRVFLRTGYRRGLKAVGA